MVEKKRMLRSCLSLLSKNALPVIIDLFSGCGGLAFGFKSAGFKIAHGIEMSKPASNTASYNLYWSSGEDGEHTCADITKSNPKDFEKDVDENGCIVIGGPPCQAYSQIGRAKLRSLGSERSHLNDSRGYLFEDFIRFALDLDARAIVMENVPEAVNYGGLNIPQHVSEILEENGYIANWTILNAADYGVPQVRERVILVAIKKSENKTYELPFPTHRSKENKLTPNQMRFKSLIKSKNFIYSKTGNDSLPNWITVSEAISDLPSLFPTSKSKYRLYQPNIQLNYRNGPQSDYQMLMRNWNGVENISVSGHGFRRTLRDFPIFERMSPGDNYLDASKIADELFVEACRVLSISESKQPEEYEKLKKAIIPPYDREKFITKWKKLHPDKPSHTLVAHLSTDTYSHLHPWEPRGISVREAARLQSFPDNFLFQCSMGDAFKQIGNAVPPLLSKAIATSLAETFNMNKQAVKI